MNLHLPTYAAWINALKTERFFPGTGYFYRENSLGIPQHDPFGVLCEIHPDPPEKWRKFCTMRVERFYSLLFTGDEKLKYDTPPYNFLYDLITGIRKLENLPHPEIAEYIDTFLRLEGRKYINENDREDQAKS